MERGARERRRRDARSHPRRRLDRHPRDGTTDTKARTSPTSSGARKFSGGVTETDVMIRAYGDTAVAAGSSGSTVTLNGQPQGGELHFTRVYIKRNGEWKMIVSHATRRPRKFTRDSRVT